MTEPSTPLMRQYAAVKKEHPTALLFFRLGDFYELFFDDAIVASKELQITLTSRNKEKGIAVPMCGVPYHAAEGYIGKLIRRGFKVAICELMEDARLAKKLVRREVTRVVKSMLRVVPVAMRSTAVLTNTCGMKHLMRRIIFPLQKPRTSSTSSAFL